MKKIAFKKDILWAGLSLLIILSAGFSYTITSPVIFQKPLEGPVAQSSAVLLNNQSEIIPLKKLAERKIASINIGTAFSGPFDAMLRNYAPVKSFTWGLFNPEEVSSFNTLILQVNDQTVYDPKLIDFLTSSFASKEVIIAGYGKVSALQRLDGFKMPIFWSPDESVKAAEHAAQVIFGGEGTDGRLAVSIGLSFPRGSGFSTWQTRLRYNVSPEEFGIDSGKLARIDGIVKEAINEHATPGAVVMVVKQGNVIFNKAYGTHTYDTDVPTKTDDIFDLASVTKIGATTMAAMRLYEQKKLDLNAGIGEYLPSARSTNKENIPIHDVMLHEAGFVNLDFTSAVKALDHSPDSSFYYPSKVSDNFYMRRNYYHDVMWPKMLQSPTPTRGQYVYSDISMYVMKEVIEHQAKEPLDQYVLEQFYQPLGMRTAGFNPRRRFDKEQIVPTENDTYFRRTLLQGYVHDQGAGLADGVSGHAGLFASANDLAVLNQMLLNGGTYGGEDYFKPATVDLFTSRQSHVSYRGFGFDRSSGHGYPSKLASTETYGHTGYTGTCVWVDPKYKLVYIFLSNRVNPSVSNKLNSLRIRPRIQDVVYEAMLQGENSLASIGN